MKSESKKDTNPKDAVGIRKVPTSCVPANVKMELGLAMMEGALKYGRHNYRDAGVRASVYYDGANRHLDAWWEGEDLDPDSGLSHVTKAIASLVVLRDCMMRGNVVDDRPPKSPDGWLSRMNEGASTLIDRYPVPAHLASESTRVDSDSCDEQEVYDASVAHLKRALDNEEEEHDTDLREILDQQVYDSKIYDTEDEAMYDELVRRHGQSSMIYLKMALVDAERKS